MGQFNPFYRSNSGGGSGGGGSSEIVRYKIEKSLENSKTIFKLKQSINGASSYVGDIITFDAADISFDSEKAQTVEEALNYLLNFTEGNYNFTTFQELGIDTFGKTMEQILSEVLSKNLPVNTIITGQIYKSAAPELRWTNAEAEIQITEGGDGQQIYWCSASSIDTSPYQWNSIYYADDINSPINQTLDWTPTYYELPTASTTEKGGIIVGNTLNIDSNGVLNINLDNIKSIEKIEFTSSTGGDTPGIAGATDTYTIILTDNTTYTFVVYNGNNGGDGHTHENKDVLDKLGEQGGELTYNGEEVFRVWHGTKQEYDALSEKSEYWTYIITDDESSVSEFTSELKAKLDGIEEGANNYVHPDVSGTKTQYGEISVNDFTISISNAPFKFGDLANASQCGVPIENAKGEHSLCANSFTSTSECAESSSAFGYATKAGAKQQLVAGRYNTVDEGDIDRTDELYGIGQYVFILGNGLSPDKLSNALAVDWKGNIFCDGDETSLNAQIDANTEKFGDYLPLTGGTLTGQLKGPMFVGDLTGNADTATKLATARTINGASFDGTTNIKVPLLNCYAYDDSSTFSDTPWHKVASCSFGGANTDAVLIMHVDKGWGNTSNGILKARIRSSNTAGKYYAGELIWQVAANNFMTEGASSIANPNFVLVYTEDTTNGKLTAELWVKITTQYDGWQFNVISMGNRVGSGNNNLWTLYNSSSGVASHTSGTGTIISSCQAIGNPAAALYDDDKMITHINTSTIKTSTDSYFKGFVGMSQNPAARFLYTYSTEAVKSELGITDSGWNNLILGETGQVEYRKIGSLVEVRGQYKPATSGGGFTIGTMPEGYRPSTYKAVSTLANEANNMLFLMRVYTDGEVNISGYNAKTFTAGTVYDLHIQYFVD